ncbi:NUDIX domain-containing protein [Halobacillus litoralis]|uniref:NUDIX domain-containing protein n=1 Tax=Halobacillus litoralis TaxID=45668 RepID=UPI0019291EB0|nr:NUDIX domain-containing protein [Halobacillus litoralis]
MDYVKELRKDVGTKPLILPGAVVIIENDQQEILLQHRKDGGWGLPGGLMELGESLEDTARREEVKVDGDESREVTFFSRNQLPAGLTKEYLDYLQPFLKKHE